MSPLDLTSDENWHGGGYELAIEIGPRDDDRLDAAIRACWADALLQGCWAGRALRLSEPCLEPTLEAHERHGHLHGIVAIPGFGSTVCGSVTIREDESHIDWLDFYLPIGALSTVDARADSLWNSDSPVAYAFRKPIDDYLAGVAARVAGAAAFDLGLIGFEVSGTVYRSDLDQAVAAREQITMLVPNARGDIVRVAHPYVEPGQK